jgi:pyruvate/2-oxoglutarate dehydrogenase complex dihydrolipoamide acyltransferase (E2) component
MALTGHLSDLSLSELIEFFCNQRKSGRLKVLYPQGAGYFYLQTGSVVDARIGVLHGIDAVYYALTLPNAEFEFSAEAETDKRTINQPWTQVVLEGLRRLDENISPGVAFPPDYVAEPDELASEASKKSGGKSETERSFPPAFLSLGKESGGRRKPIIVGAIAVAILASVAVIGVPAGWYKSTPAATAAAEPTTTAAAPQSTQAETPAQPQASETTTAPATEDPAEAARRQREKERRAREAARAAETAGTVPSQPVAETAKLGAKRVVVTVTYDESGRVTQASGGDANALRIARQKRFPPGKAGSATITIPIN